MNTLFTISNKYFEVFGNQKLKIEEERYSKIVLMKVELIKDLVLVNDEIIRNWKNEIDNGQYVMLKKSIYKIKNS